MGPLTEGLSQIHLKDQIGKDLLLISVIWLLAGFAFLQAVVLRASVPHWLSARRGLSSLSHELLHEAAHNRIACFIQAGKEEEPSRI